MEKGYRRAPSYARKMEQMRQQEFQHDEELNNARLSIVVSLFVPCRSAGCTTYTRLPAQKERSVDFTSTCPAFTGFRYPGSVRVCHNPISFEPEFTAATRLFKLRISS